jgi:hypothetical protein
MPTPQLRQVARSPVLETVFVPFAFGILSTAIAGYEFRLLPISIAVFIAKNIWEGCEETWQRCSAFGPSLITVHFLRAGG